MREFSYVFRGIEYTIVVDQYDVDYETNALDVSWHFDDLTPEQHDDLAITDLEEDAIIDFIGERIDE